MQLPVVGPGVDDEGVLLQAVDNGPDVDRVLGPLVGPGQIVEEEDGGEAPLEVEDAPLEISRGFWRLDGTEEGDGAVAERCFVGAVVEGNTDILALQEGQQSV